MAKKNREKRVKDPLASTTLEKILYGLGDVGVNIIWALPSSFLMLYYTDSVGISAAYIGTMMLICRLFDGVSDILMGMVIDKTHTRWGKARPWLLFMGLPLIVSVFLTFRVPGSWAEGAQKAYAFVTYFIMSVVCYTAVNLAYHSMLPRFSLTSQDRSVTSVIRSIFSLVITIAVSTVTTMLLSAFGGMSSQQAWSTVVIIYGVIAEIAILVTFLGVKEKSLLDDAGSKSEEEHPSLGHAIKILLSSRYFYIAVYLFFAFYIANGTSGIMVYYARDIMGNANLMGLLSIAGIVPIMLGSPFCPALFKRFGKRNTMFYGMILAAVCSALKLVNPTNLVWYLVFSFITSLGSAPLMSAMYTLAGDIVDYNQWKHGVRTEGIATSVNSIGMKVGTGLGSALLGWLLAWGHYDAALAQQPASAIRAMIIVAIVIPIVIYATAAIVLAFWDLEKYQSEILAFLSSKESGN
jgi:GPH family glycoside/pentoside/hexuronide:cation symporter